MDNSKEKLLTLWRYHAWSRRLRKTFKSHLESEGEFLKQEGDLGYFFLSQTALFLFYWYASLYVVADGYCELKLQNRLIGPLFSTEHIEILRLFRNGMFHYQAECYHTKLMDMLTGYEENVVWLDMLDVAFRVFFKESVGCVLILTNTLTKLL